MTTSDLRYHGMKTTNILFICLFIRKAKEKKRRKTQQIFMKNFFVCSVVCRTSHRPKSKTEIFNATNRSFIVDVELACLNGMNARGRSSKFIARNVLHLLDNKQTHIHHQNDDTRHDMQIKLLRKREKRAKN